MAVHARGCAGFWLYGLAGGLIAFSALAAASIGFVTALPALLALLVAVRVARGRGQPLGLATGAGLLCVAIAILNAGETHGPGPTPWAIAGALLTGAGILAYALVRRGL